MNAPHSKADLIKGLSQVQQDLTTFVQNLSPAQFSSTSGSEWPASGYLKHLLLSIKPFAKAIHFPAEQLQRRFGLSDRPSISYDELVAKYDARLAEGAKAEDYDKILPMSFRIPEEVTDEKAYLLELWNDANNRLIQALKNWEEADLDRYQLPHPALMVLTVRETFFFTLYHNTLHWNDIQRVSSRVSA